MSKINLTPNAGGTGTLTVTSPNTNTDYTLTLPSGTGTFNISGTPNEVPAGTVSAPSIYFTGDTNTGIYSPGADSIAFTEGGSEAMRIDSSGRVGIGTTSPNRPLTVYGGDGYIQMLNASTGTASGDGSFIGVEGGTTALRICNQENDVLTFHTNGIANERGRFDNLGNFQFNSGYGSVATAYGCRAWVNFNGTGTVAIRASGNVTSITDNGTGDYTVNFTTAMPDANYSVVSIGTTDATTYTANVQIKNNSALATGSVRIDCYEYNNTATKRDPVYVLLSIFR